MHVVSVAGFHVRSQSSLLRHCQWQFSVEAELETTRVALKSNCSAIPRTHKSSTCISQSLIAIKRIRMSFLVKCRDVSSTVLYESGVKAISKSSRDVKLLCLQRCVRMFGYGATFLILVHFMTSLGITDAQVGVFMTFTLLGDVVISFCLTLITDKVGRRLILIAGSAMMSFSGIVFALSSNYRLLLFASVIGVISPRYEKSAN